MMSDKATEPNFLSENLVNSDFDINKIYSDFSEIGHGHFGLVYSAISIETNQTVAIKKLNIKFKKQKDQTQQIERELKVLRSIDHPNCVKLIEYFYERSFVWIVMEYCLGSALDALSLHEFYLDVSAGLTEALKYLHGKELIHRDIKAANILLNAEGTVKLDLADFGSTSLKSNANSFVGSPYWMAPEVINTSNELLYDSRADIWSLGITSIELAQKKPPLYHMNALHAIHHISEKEPPKLIDESWSENFRNFTNSILKYKPEDRPTADALLNTPFLANDQPPSIIMELLLECAECAQKNDSLAYRKFLSVIDDNGSNSPSQTVDETSSVHIINVPKITSKIEEMSTNKESTKTKNKRLYTIKSTATVYKEVDQHHDPIYLDMKEYQALRKTNQKELKYLEQKLEAEIQDHIKSQKKIIEATIQNDKKNLDQLEDQHEAEVQRLCRQHKETCKKWEKDRDIKICKKGSSLSVKSLNRSSQPHKRLLSFSFIKHETNEDKKPPPEIESSNLITDAENIYKDFEEKMKELKSSFLFAKYSILHYNEKIIGRFKEENVTSLAKLELNRIEQIFHLKQQHLIKLHAFEKRSQQSYMREKLKELRQRHASNLKNQPKEFKLLQSTMIKKFKDEVKRTEQQYKLLARIKCEKAPKDLHAEIKKKYENEKIAHVLKKQHELQQRINSILTKEKVKLDEVQTKERSDLEEELNFENISLSNSQQSQLQHLDDWKAQEIERIVTKYDEMLESVRNENETNASLLKEEMATSLGSVSEQFNDVFHFDSSTTLDNANPESDHSSASL